MHTVKEVRGAERGWVVQFVELGSNAPGYRPDRDNIAWFRSAMDAYAFCSHLNGGELELSEQGFEDLRRAG